VEASVSEYQYYEFLAIDRPLSVEELAYVRSLSRRVQPTPSQAVFTYAYGDFPGDPLKLLAKHYDIMLYLANWGSRQLAFRFPKTALDQQVMEPYYYGVEEIELTTVGQHVILNIAFHEGEPLGWIEDDEAQLAPLAPLRDDILRGDLRALYLAWLASAARETGMGRESDDEDWDDEEERDDSDDLIEPPIPPGLGQLTVPLRAFMEFFGIDQDLVGAAALTSPPLKATKEPIERWVPLLPEAERNAFLVRAARGEAIGAELLRRLREIGGEARPAASTASRRTFSAIVAAAGDVRRQRQQRERQEAERARLAKLEALAKREEQVWAQLPGLLAQRTARGYDQAVAHLAELRDLAVHRKQRAAFDARLKDVLAPYATSAALLRRLREKKLVG
jgi:hypothetical protein